MLGILEEGERRHLLKVLMNTVGQEHIPLPQFGLQDELGQVVKKLNVRYYTVAKSINLFFL